MLDIKFVRENPDVVKENIKKKFQDHKLHLVDEVIELDEERRQVIASLISAFVGILVCSPVSITTAPETSPAAIIG